MNERIKKFSEQAIHYAASRPMPELKDRDLYLDNLFEKFAELIVQECQVALHPMLRDMVSRGRAYELIKQHFGVEE